MTTFQPFSHVAEGHQRRGFLYRISAQSDLMPQACELNFKKGSSVTGYNMLEAHSEDL
jgi:hypothetical protein